MIHCARCGLPIQECRERRASDATVNRLHEVALPAIPPRTTHAHTLFDWVEAGAMVIEGMHHGAIVPLCVSHQALRFCLRHGAPERMMPV